MLFLGKSFELPDFSLEILRIFDWDSDSDPDDAFTYYKGKFYFTSDLFNHKFENKIL